MQSGFQRYEHYAYSVIGWRCNDEANGRNGDEVPNRRAYEMRLLSRRDGRIQPGVLTPGYQRKNTPPRRGGRRLLPNDGSIAATTNGYLSPLQGGSTFRPDPGLNSGLSPVVPAGRKSNLCTSETRSRRHSIPPLGWVRQRARSALEGPATPHDFP